MYGYTLTRMRAFFLRRRQEVLAGYIRVLTTTTPNEANTAVASGGSNKTQNYFIYECSSTTRTIRTALASSGSCVAWWVNESHTLTYMFSVSIYLYTNGCVCAFVFVAMHKRSSVQWTDHWVASPLWPNDLILSALFCSLCTIMSCTCALRIFSIYVVGGVCVEMARQAECIQRQIYCRLFVPFPPPFRPSHHIHSRLIL